MLCWNKKLCRHSNSSKYGGGLANTSTCVGNHCQSQYKAVDIKNIGQVQHEFHVFINVFLHSCNNIKKKKCKSKHKHDFCPRLSLQAPVCLRIPLLYLLKCLSVSSGSGPASQNVPKGSNGLELRSTHPVGLIIKMFIHD